MANDGPEKPGAGPSSDNDAGGKSGGEDSNGGGQQAGGQDPVAAAKERLSKDQAQAGMAQAAGASGGAAGGDIKGEISKQTSKINHWMLEAEYQMIAMDFSTIGLSLFLTLPARIVFCGILLLELKHGVTRSKSMIPFFPKLTWESFMPPATEISVPLPTVPLQIAVLAYLIGVATITTVAVGIVAIILVGLGSAGTVVVEGLSSLFGS